MNDSGSEDFDEGYQLPSPLASLLRHYELWLAERIPGPVRDPVFWDGKRIEYDKVQQRLEPERKHVVAPSPYPGLRSFTPHEGQLFFGRRSDVEQVRDKLKAHRMVMVLGGSGSGKSSLIRAGVLPFLNSVGGIGGRGGTWYWCELRPERAPIDNLLDALTKHVVLPLLKAIASHRKTDPEVEKGLELLGLSAEATHEQIRAWVAAPFTAATDGEELFEALWEFVDTRLDRLDELASGGFQSDKPNILILLDQFEEVFRKGATPEQKAQEDALFRLLAKMDERLRTAPWSEGGLFMVLTMRSEELHRCGERHGLTNIVNRSMFLLELLDAQQQADREVLHQAIVEPARKVFTSYRLPFDRANRDSPFGDGVPDWLIDGAAQQWQTLEHRPDQLPLLQHALRAIWHCALTRWKSPNGQEQALRIEKIDLPGDIEATSYPDFDLCLSEQADEAAEEARGRFRHYEKDEPPVGLSEVECPEGEIALRTAFSTLARQDDRGNAARRFASPDEIVRYLEHHALTRGLPSLRERVKQALIPLAFHGYLAGGNGRPYDVSHEALLRNWEKCKSWLNDNKNVVDALKHLLDDSKLDEVRRSAADAEALADVVPETVLAQMANIGEAQIISEAWARDQLELLLDASEDRRRRWIGEEAAGRKPTDEEVASVLAQLQRIVDDARAARKKRDEDKARKEEQAKLVPDLVRARRTAERRTRIAMALLALFVFASLFAGYVSFRSSASFKTAGRTIAVMSLETPAGKQASFEGRLGVLEYFSPRRSMVPLGSSSAALFLASVWDRLAREVIGGEFRVSRTSAPAVDAKLLCWTQTPEGAWISKGARTDGKITHFASTRTSLEVLPKGASLQLHGNGRDVGVNLATLPGLPPLAPGSELCLSSAGSTLTATVANSVLPNIYELAIVNCEKQCTAVVRQIQPSVANSKLAQMLRGTPSVSYISDARPGELVKVGFSSPHSAHPFEAQYYLGWAAAVRYPDPNSSAPPLSGDAACTSPKDHRLQRINLPEEEQSRVQAWTCNTGAIAEVALPVIDPSRPPAFVQMRAARRAKTKDGPPLREVTALVPSGATPVREANGLLIFREGSDYWAVKIDQEALWRTIASGGDPSAMPAVANRLKDAL